MSATTITRAGHPDRRNLRPTPSVVRIAAVADLHLRTNPTRRFRRSFRDAARQADVLLLAGDLTDSGTAAEAQLVAEDVADLPIPVLAVLGNHDHAADKPTRIIDILTAAGVRVLEGTGTVLTCGGVRLGVAGCKGYGGGFPPTVVHEHGEPQTRSFVRHARTCAQQLATALGELDCDLKLALTHYAPTTDTLAGEPPQLHLVLGSHLLGQAIDEAGAALAIHGHAHRGSERGYTPAGVPVRNVAYKVIGTGYRIYTLQPSNRDSRRWRVIDHDHPER